jgi:hypothetical protein
MTTSIGENGSETDGSTIGNYTYDTHQVKDYLRIDTNKMETDGITTIGITLIVGALLFLAMHAIGPSPVPFIAPGDLFDNEPKVAASSLSASVTWIGMLTVALTFPLCQLYLKSFMLVPFIIVIVFQIVPFYIYFPETKGMSNTKIASMFQVEKPWRTAIGLKRLNATECLCPCKNNNNLPHNQNIETVSIKTISTDF